MSFSSLFRKKSIESILNTNTDDGHGGGLAKQLGVRDLTAFGIAAIIGAGIFSTIGRASADGGPAVIFLFIFTAIACGFAAFAYAEFASMVPVSGSAYTYSYVAFGELIAWIIGWALIMEYAIGNVTVAISWSDYFTSLLGSMNVHLPLWLSTDHMTAAAAFTDVSALLAAGKDFSTVDAVQQEAYNAYTSAPTIGGLHILFDLPALLIVFVITWLVYRGMKETRNASNIMVAVKMCVVLLVILVGIFYVDTSNWSPFAPNGIGGVMKGVSAVFFAYIGFDAISTTAEECRNPQRDLPRGMMWAIIICTILYIAIALILTGMVNYTELNVGDPLAFVFEKLHLSWFSGIIAVSAVVAMASVLLVFQLGQPRIWMSMSRDGLLPKKFATIHPKFQTPSFATIVTGLLVAVPIFFVNSALVTDLCSIGTLFAFVLVCGGVLRLQTQKDVKYGKFRTPYINGRFIYPALLLITAVWIFNNDPAALKDFINNNPQTKEAEAFITDLNEGELQQVKQYVLLKDSLGLQQNENDLIKYMSSITPELYQRNLDELSIDGEKKIVHGWNLFKHKITMWIFILTCLVMAYFAFRHKLSLIPLLGLVSCLYLMCGIPVVSWAWFFIWLCIGLVIYFGYGRKKSKLAVQGA